MNNKEKYRELCKREKTIPIFSKDWWLDAVCDEQNWDVVLVEKSGDIVASLPYYMNGRLGVKQIIMPKLTQTMGIWLRYPEGQKYTTKLSYEKEIMGELIDTLPKFDYFSQNFHYDITNWLPFYWKGFKQTTRYTYVIEELNELDKVFGEFSSNIKTDIKKAQKNLEVYTDDNIEKFYEINKMTFSRQNINISYSLELLKKLDTACATNGCRKIFFAKDDNTNIHAAIYIIWDKQSTYYLMGGGNPELRNSGATSLLVWEAIKFAATVTKRFNFEGSMIESVERFFRAFGAKQMPYFNITKDNRTSPLRSFAFYRDKLSNVKRNLMQFCGK